jgi:UDP-N-acetylglucosamine diphosphorylase / glucose-1-phosphate thymidylyltransferase / UDP-N-acetylgalactosamine diphosphorylase / glucosamine-1-phosphate N-acetyltransferase / galactosamine-1-phosphate N-acetyltransferase
MKAVLPVAGNGTRMAPLGVTTPKCLIPILNKPLIVWSLEALLENDITDVVVVISAGNFGNKIRDFIEKELTNYPGMNKVNIEIAIQEQQLGTAHVVQVTKDHFEPGEHFIFMYGDDLYSPKTIRQVLESEILAVVGQEVSDPEKWGIFQADEKGNLIKVVEKPEEDVGNLANIGAMKLSTRIFEIYDQLKVSKRGEFELTDSLQILADETEVAVIKNDDYWIPIGYPWHILDAVEYFAPKIESKIEGVVEDGVVINGTVVLPKSSTIKSGTVIDGTLVVGENVTIGPGAYIRKNVVVGDNSFIGFSVEVKNSSIGKNTLLAHFNMLGDSVLGNNVNLAAGTKVANLRHDQQTIKTPVKGKLVDTRRKKLGMIIGDNVNMGINTSVYPGRKIWPNLTTRPGQVVDKDLTE